MELKRFDERTETERGDVKYRFIDTILIDELQIYVINSLNQYGSDEKLAEANKLCDVIVQMLQKKKLIDAQTHQSFVDILLVSALLHNLFFDSKEFLNGNETNWEDLYKARRILEPIAFEMGMNRQVTDPIFSTVEAQLGEDTLVTTSMAKPNTPTEMFAYAVWISKEYRAQ